MFLSWHGGASEDVCWPHTKSWLSTWNFSPLFHTQRLAFTTPIVSSKVMVNLLLAQKALLIIKHTALQLKHWEMLLAENLFISIVGSSLSTPQKCKFHFRLLKPSHVLYSVCGQVQKWHHILLEAAMRTWTITINASSDPILIRPSHVAQTGYD